jgi:N-acetylglucosaminyldiphosphoundecaprenol N-acetyl-beta-D-mannosaminyltransferase
VNHKDQKNIALRDFSRPIVSLLGMPIDALNFTEMQLKLRQASKSPIPTVLSTPNLNFLLLARADSDFNQSLLQSDIVALDGVSLLWISKLLGICNLDKSSGSNLFQELWDATSNDPISVFLFGGDEDIAELAHHTINSKNGGIVSKGYLNPGVGSVEDLSTEAIIEKINSANANFLVVSLGAKKGQRWIFKNQHLLNNSLISHLGAVLNFTAGTTLRAPTIMQRLGLEWLWRIKEQPALFKRYWDDGKGFLTLLRRNVLPYAFFKWRHIRSNISSGKITIKTNKNRHGLTITIAGEMTLKTVDSIKSTFKIFCTEPVVKLDLSTTTSIDEYGVGQILLLLKHVGSGLSISASSDYVQHVFQYENLNYLLDLNDHT